MPRNLIQVTRVVRRGVRSGVPIHPWSQYLSRAHPSPPLLGLSSLPALGGGGGMGYHPKQASHLKSGDLGSLLKVVCPWEQESPQHEGAEDLGNRPSCHSLPTSQHMFLNGFSGSCLPFQAPTLPHSLGPCSFSFGSLSISPQRLRFSRRMSV